MASTSTYLNFPGTTEEAFLFYREAFGGEFLAPIQRMRDVPVPPDAPPMPEALGNLVMHVSLAILGGHVLMGTDAVAELGHPVTMGTNVYLSLAPDTRAETDRLFAALAEGGEIQMPLQQMFWGAYYGSLRDRFGTQWMFNCTAPA